MKPCTRMGKHVIRICGVVRGVRANHMSLEGRVWCIRVKKIHPLFVRAFFPRTDWRHFEPKHWGASEIFTAELSLVTFSTSFSIVVSRVPSTLLDEKGLWTGLWATACEKGAVNKDACEKGAPKFFPCGAIATKNHTNTIYKFSTQPPLPGVGLYSLNIECIFGYIIPPNFPPAGQSQKEIDKHNI